MKKKLLFIVFLLIVSGSVKAVWDIETVDSVGDVGWYASMVLDSSNRPHIAYMNYTDRDLKYARWDGSSWQIQIVDGAARACGKYASIDLNASGYPVIAYESNSITCAIANDAIGSSWTIMNTGSSIAVGYGVDLAVGTDNSIHITNSDTDYSNLYYAKYNGTLWNNEIIDTSSPMESSIKLDTSNNPYIAYVTNSDNVYLQNWNGSVWQDLSPPATLSTDGYWPSMQLDSTGNPHISFSELDSSEQGDLMYYFFNGSSWVLESPDAAVNTTVGMYSSLVLDAGNHAHISYHDNTNWKLKYVTNTTGSWVKQFVDPVTAEYFYSSIQLDTAGNPHITYYDQVNQDLKYARWVAGAHTVSGTIADGVGTGIEGVYVFMTGNGIGSNTMTDSNGYYEFAAVESGGDYTVTPMLAGYTFSPANHVYNSLSTDQSAQNYVITVGSGYFIRGYLVDSHGVLITNATVQLTGDSAGTYSVGSDGYYEFINLAAGTSYNIRPGKTGYVFEPESIDYSNIEMNHDSQNYIGTDTTVIVLHTISGFVLHLDNEPLVGAVVTLTGDAQDQRIIDNHGSYSFGLESGDYTVTVTKPDFNFEPPSRSYVNLSGNQAAQNYIGSHSNTVADNNEVKIIPGILSPGVVSNGAYRTASKHVTIRFNQDKTGKTIIRLYTIDGVYVTTIIEEEKTAGTHEVTWSGINLNNEIVASGIYFVEVKTPGYRKLKKICVIK